MITLPEDVLSDLQKSPTFRKHLLIFIRGMRRATRRAAKELGLTGKETESTRHITSELKKIEEQLKKMNNDGAGRKKQKPS